MLRSQSIFSSCTSNLDVHVFETGTIRLLELLFLYLLFCCCYKSGSCDISCATDHMERSIHQVFTFHLCMLQLMKNLSQGRQKEATRLLCAPHV